MSPGEDTLPTTLDEKEITVCVFINIEGAFNNNTREAIKKHWKEREQTM